jgi:hypothetical protein
VRVSGGPPSGGLGRRRRSGLTGQTAAVLGTGVSAAVPLQRQRPALILGLSVAELAAFAALVVTAHVVALAALALLSVCLVGVGAANRRRVLAITSNGPILVAASARGRPLVPIGPAPRGLSLPPPSGLGVGVVLDGATWWIERSAFARLRQARAALGQAGHAR